MTVAVQQDTNTDTALARVHFQNSKYSFNYQRNSSIEIKGKKKTKYNDYSIFYAIHKCKNEDVCEVWSMSGAVQQDISITMIYRT